MTPEYVFTWKAAWKRAVASRRKANKTAKERQRKLHYTMYRELVKLFKSHEILWYLIEQEQKIQHRDKLLGNVWLLLNPLMMMIVLFFVFKEIRHMSAPFCLYLFSGLMVWDILAKTLVGCTACIHNRVELVQKFPLPLSLFPVVVVLHKIYDVLCGLIAYAMIFVVIAVTVAPAGTFKLSPAMALFPVWLVFFLVAMLGIGFILARIGVYFVDIRDILEIFLRLGFFLNPVFLEMSWVPTHLHKLYFLLNPIGGYIFYFRKVLPGGDAILHNYQIPVPYYPVYLGAVTILLFVGGFRFFLCGARDYAKYI